VNICAEFKHVKQLDPVAPVRTIMNLAPRPENQVAAVAQNSSWVRQGQVRQKVETKRLWDATSIR